MSRSPAHALLLTRRFGCLFASQFLGVVADNVAKTAVAIALLLGGHGSSAAAIATALFVLPYALFASVAGNMADRMRKSRAARIVKLLEIPVMGFAGFAVWSGEPILLCASMLLAGCQATFFSPVKYGVLPELTQPDELVAANAWIEAGTFLGILLGTISGGVIGEWGSGPLALGVLVSLSTIGAAFAFCIPQTRQSDPTIRLSFVPLQGVRCILRELRGWKRAHAAAVGLSWFWMCGAVLLAEIPVYARDALGQGADAATVLLAAMAIGIGSGSMAFSLIAKRPGAAASIPLGFIGMGFAILGSLAVPHATPLSLWLGALSLFAASFCGGMASVPLYVALQEGAPRDARARAVAASNLLNAIYMVVGSVLAAVAAAIVSGLGGSPIMAVRIVLAMTATLSLIAAIPALFSLPEVAIAIFGRLLRTIYRIEVRGLENLPAADQPAVLTPNHVTWLDGALLAGSLPGRPAFAVNSLTAQKWWVRWAVDLIDALPLDPTNPMAVKSLIQAVRGGRHAVVFPEGRLTRTGGLMKVYDGPAVIAHRANAVIVPVRIDGGETSIWTRLKGVYHRHLFPRITITILPPRRIALAAGVFGKARREALSRGLYDIMEQAAFESFDIGRTLFTALRDAAALHGEGTQILEDMQRRPITYRRLIQGSCLLGREIAKQAAVAEAVGVLLPNTNAFAATYFGLQAFGLVPALLNYSTGAEGMIRALGIARVSTIVTSRLFIEKARLQATIEQLECHATIVYLEDIQHRVTRTIKLRAFLDALMARRLPGARTVSPDAPAVILFTSGSEGTPKGVVLSHRNLLSNAGQARARIDFNPSDVTLNALPCFHSFGLTVGFLLPLLNGIKCVLYPNPLHFRQVPEVAYDTEATILFGTDTFLAGYGRKAHPYDFRSVRYIFAGAEKIRDETRRLWAERFGVRILEGYGTTETGPVLAINTAMHSKTGSVGRLMTGIDHRLEPVEGLDRGQRLFVKGPNVMLGYLKADHPGVLQPPQDGWYDTGDIVEIDEAGFVHILGRAKRFAKIAGEMVSLSAVEDWAAALWPDCHHAVIAVPDSRKGERVVLVTTKSGAARGDLATFIRAQHLPEIATPAELRIVSTLPLLGTGKTNYAAVKALVEAPSV